MKLSLALSIITALALKTSAENCFAEQFGYECCSNENTPVEFASEEGEWGVENGQWCGIKAKQPAEEPKVNECFAEQFGYECCSNENTPVEFASEEGEWGVENGIWCGIKAKQPAVEPTTTQPVEQPTEEPKVNECFSEQFGYECCSDENTPVEFTTEEGEWGVENGYWCGIKAKQPAVEPTTTQPVEQPTEEPKVNKCFAEQFGYECCSDENTKVEITDEVGEWGIEYGQWCGIIPKNPDAEQPTEKPKDEAQYTINGNPFEGVQYYINPNYVAKVDNAIAQMTDETLIAKAEKMKEYSNAIWLNSIETMNNVLEESLANAFAQQNATGEPVLTVFVLNDIPGRDCHLVETNAELGANDKDFERYKVDFIDVIAEKLTKYKSQPIALIVEPTALANTIINTEYIPACQEAEKYIKEAHAYLIKKLGVFPHVALYLDMANTFWLGWDDISDKVTLTYKEVIKSGSPGSIRGFSTNVGQYDSWMNLGDYDDDIQYSPDERRFIDAMRRELFAKGVQTKYLHFIVDTSRNGQGTLNNNPNAVCNEKTVAVGNRPQANPDELMPHVDAFYWVKPLGESDGSIPYETSNESCMNNAPKVGEWFQRQFELGITNANPPL